MEGLLGYPKRQRVRQRGQGWEKPSPGEQESATSDESEGMLSEKR